jgi:formylglycine-generating enzyme required for sulfatase activity
VIILRCIIGLTALFLLVAILVVNHSIAQQSEVRESSAAAVQENAEVPADAATDPGIVSEKPDSGPCVEIENGFMVPYTATIPGTEVEYRMIPIPGGTFKLGSPSDETGRHDDEGPQVEVKIEPFWMGQYEVTWSEYKQYMKLDKVFKAFEQKKIRQVTEENKVDAITAPSALYDPSFTFEAGDAPTEPAASMTQFAAKQYTKWLSGLTQRFYRLPTEAEWEYACRAGTTTAYYFGDDPEQLEKHGWYHENADEYRHDCGKLTANPWGLYDMYGNVAEWVLDQYSDNGYEKLGDQPQTVESAYNRPTKLFPRVVRGGSFETEEALECRSASRMGSDDEEWKDEDPNVPNSPWWYTTSPGLGVGFRIIRPLTPPATKEKRQAFWNADLESIERDAQNRIKSNGRGAYGLADPELPTAISELTSKDR